MAATRKDNPVPVFTHAIYAAINMVREKVTLTREMCAERER